MQLQALKFWGSSEPMAIPDNMQDLLKQKFHVEPQKLANWRMLQKSANYSGQKITRVRLFNPSKLKAKQYRTYDDLPKDSVLFEGRIEKKGDISLFDQRRRSEINSAT